MPGSQWLINVSAVLLFASRVWTQAVWLESLDKYTWYLHVPYQQDDQCGFVLEGSRLWRIDGCWSPALWGFPVMVDVLITEHMKRGLGQCRPRLRGGRGFVSGLPPRRSLWERHCFHMTYHRKKRAFSTAGTLAEAVAGFLRGSGRPQQLVTLWPCFPQGVQVSGVFSWSPVSPTLPPSGRQCFWSACGGCGAGLNLSCLPVLSLGSLAVERPVTTGQLGGEPSSAGWSGPRGKGLWSQATPRQEVLGGVQSLPVRTSRQGLVSGTWVFQAEAETTEALGVRKCAGPGKPWPWMCPEGQQFWSEHSLGEQGELLPSGTFSMCVSDLEVNFFFKM